jgi:hypothetical protein
MPVPGGGFEQCCNAQAAVDTETMPGVVPVVAQAPNDKEQVAPPIEKIHALPEGLNRQKRGTADAGCFSAANVDACEAAEIEPLIAVARARHYLPVWERFEEPPELAPDAIAVEGTAHRLKTKVGRAAYAMPKQTVEPVFGLVKSVMGKSLRSAPAAWTKS